MGLEKPPQLNSKSTEEITPLDFEKFPVWNVFNNDVMDIGFTSIEGSRGSVNTKIRSLQRRVDKYLTRLDISKEGYDDTFDHIIKHNNTDEALEELTDCINRVSDDIRKKFPDAEKIEREEWIEALNVIPVNQLVAYNKPDYFLPEILNIHIFPNRTTGLKEKLGYLREGFKNLAQIVNANDKIQKVVGDTWISVEHPELVKKLGFKVEKDLKEEFKRVFIDKTRKKSNTISMTREEFLKRYLI